MNASTPSHQATSPQRTARRATTLVHIGVALLVIGMALVIGGILSGPLFLPGTWVILLGILACAAAAIVRMVQPAVRENAANRTGSARPEDA